MTVYMLKIDGKRVGTYPTRGDARLALAEKQHIVLHPWDHTFEIVEVYYDHDTELMDELRKEARDDGCR